MVKCIVLTLLSVLCLVGNKKMFLRKGGKQTGYWVISFLAVFVFAVAMLQTNLSVGNYLTRLVRPLLLFIYGGSYL